MFFLLYRMVELDCTKKELSDWFPERPNFPTWTARMDRSPKDLTKSSLENFRREDSFV